MTAATTTRSRNARKVLGSLGVIGAAAAVAGMGTFGSFTDSTTPLAASVTSGTLDIALTGAGVPSAPTAISAAWMAASRAAMTSPIGGPWKRRRSMANQTIRASTTNPTVMGRA